LFTLIINILKIIFLLGFLIFIHEGGHFLVAKLCKVKVNEFAIGFGPCIWKKQGKETQYAIRLIPLGGFVSMEGETEESKDEKSFANASIPRRIAIVAAGAIVNIVFGLVTYLILIAVVYQDIGLAFRATGEFAVSLAESVKMLFTGSVGVKDLTGPVGISEMVTQSVGIANYIYMIALVSVSLGVTNLLPIPALDGGKILLLIIEAIRKKPLQQRTEVQIQLIGFSLIIALSIIVTYNDILRVFNK
jgi:regulator of sigma E protease